MNFVRLLPVIFSFLLLSAHFSRQDLFVLSIICLLLPFFLFIKRVWVTKLIQIILIIGSIEWIRALFNYINQRQAISEPYLLLVIIVVTIILLTGLSALVFRNKRLREHYNL